MEYVIQNQANDYLPSLQALTQFWFMIQINIDFPEVPPPFHFSFFQKYEWWTCIDFQSIIFILILFKLRQLLSGPRVGQCISINRAVPHY